MPTITAALDALARHVGFNTARANAIARRMQDSGLLPKGTPQNPPQIDETGFVYLTLALASDTTIAASPENVRALCAATPGAVPLDGAPLCVGRALSELLALVEAATEFPSDLDGYRIEVVSTWPEIVIHHFGEVVARYQHVGSLSGRWQTSGHRRSVTINGRAFRDAVRSTFKGAH